MGRFTIEAEVSEERKLIYILPPEVPAGRVTLIIQPVEEAIAHLPVHDQVQRKLAAAGKLVSRHTAPTDALPLSDEERQRLAQLLGSGPSTLDLLNEDRGPKE